MRYPRFTAAPARMMPFAALLVATALGGCVGYTEYPSQGYSYNYPSGYYAGYPRTSPSGYRPYYSHDYPRYNDTNERMGGGNN
jgi:hypothetical protein